METENTYWSTVYVTGIPVEIRWIWHGPDQIEWHLDETVIALDLTPMGSFVEFEGIDARECAARFGLHAEAADSGSYLELWESYRLAHPAMPADMIFDPLPPEGASSEARQP